MRTHRPPRSLRLPALALAGGLAICVAACGADDGAGDTTSPTASTSAPTTAGSPFDLAAYCADEVTIDHIMGSADPEDPTAFGDAIRSAGPVVERLLAGAPPELAEHFAVLGAAYRDLAASGRPDSLFTDEVAAADDAVHAYDLAHCGWQTYRITAGDHHFGGDFPTLAGTADLEVANTGEEAHLLVVIRKHDDVAEPALDAFGAVETHEQMLERFDEVATVYVEPGSSDYALAEIEPGDYVAFCPVPAGSTAAAPGDGPPHFTMGMVTTFQVA